MWSALKKIKSDISTEMGCASYNMYPDEELLTHVLALEHLLDIESTNQTFGNVTYENLKIAAQMFVYLQSCSETTKPWIVFYKNLLETQSPAQRLQKVLEVKVHK